MNPHKKEQKTPSLDQTEEGAFFAQKIKELEKKALEWEGKALEFRETAQRVQAEFENFAKRTEKEKQAFRQVSNAGLIKEFLPLLDSFENAEKSLEKHENASKEEAVKGMKLLHKQLQDILSKNGVKKIDAVGKKFDHNLHEVMMQETKEGIGDEIITEELQAGYMLNGFVLRESKVKINKVEENKNEKTEE